jgi:hypothetical protein
VTDHGGAPAARAGGPTDGLANARRLRTPWLAPSVLTYGPLNAGRLLPKGTSAFYRALQHLATAESPAPVEDVIDPRGSASKGNSTAGTLGGAPGLKPRPNCNMRRSGIQVY